MGFTKAELDEMARADAEIEASFSMTHDDYVLQREIDREARFEALDNTGKQRTAQQRAWYAANKDKVAARKRAWYAANKDKVAAQKLAWCAANKDKVAARKRAWYAANKDKVAAQKKIAESRKSHGLTQKALAGLLGVTQPAVSLWENCMVPAPLDRLVTILPELGKDAM